MGLGVQRKAQCLSFGEHFGWLWVGWRGETASEEGLFSDVLSLQRQLRKEMAAKAPCLVRVPGSPGALCTSHGSPGPPWTQQPVSARRRAPAFAQRSVWGASKGVCRASPAGAGQEVCETSVSPKLLQRQRGLSSPATSAPGVGSVNSPRSAEGPSAGVLGVTNPRRWRCALARG